MVNNNILVNGPAKMNINEVEIQPGLYYNKITITEVGNSITVTVTTCAASSHSLYTTFEYDANNYLYTTKYMVKTKSGQQAPLNTNYSPTGEVNNKIQVIDDLSTQMQINNITNIFSQNDLKIYTGLFDIEAARSSNALIYND